MIGDVARRRVVVGGWPLVGVRGHVGVALIIFLLALAPRAFAIGSFLTIDEAYHWFDRAPLFLRAIRSANWAGTNLVGHPGVTTMWLGASGYLTHNALRDWGLATGPDADLLRILLRLPVAIVTALCVALGYTLLRRLLPARLALLSALLWAGDPFLVAHSQLLHVDALLTSFMTLAILAAMLAFRLDEADAPSPNLRWGMLIVSAIATGLALLTKSPSVLLVPIAGLIVLVRAWRTPANDKRPTTMESRRGLSFVIRRSWFVIWPLLVWGGVALLVWYAFWPAAWFDPLGALGSIIRQARDDGGSPHGWGNYFLGSAVSDPGPLFYPVAIALRLTPWASIGLVAAIPAAILAWRKGQVRRGLPLLILAVFSLLFVMIMTVGPKKFDRYALPIFPTLDIFAAFGLFWLFEQIWNRALNVRSIGRSASDQRGSATPAVRRSWLVARLFDPAIRTGAHGRFSVLGWLLVVLVLSANLALHHPYEIAYYNQLLGGGPVAATLIPVGWGEGFEQAGAYLRSRPDGADLPVATWYGPALKPFVSTPIVRLSEALQPGKVGYAVLYIDQQQRRNEPEATDWLRSRLRPIQTVRINGIDYAQIYQIPRPAAHAIDADFGTAIHVRGYDADTTTPGALALTIHWEARATILHDYMLFVHVLDVAGNVIGRADLPAGDRTSTSAWVPGSYVSQGIRVPIRADAPAGSYWIAIGVYDAGTGARLPLRIQPPAQGPSDGENALMLGPVTTR